jgi:hypothetical protein
MKLFLFEKHADLLPDGVAFDVGGLRLGEPKVAQRSQADDGDFRKARGESL